MHFTHSFTGSRNQHMRPLLLFLGLYLIASIAGPASGHRFIFLNSSADDHFSGEWEE